MNCLNCDKPMDFKTKNHNVRIDLGLPHKVDITETWHCGVCHDDFEFMVFPNGKKIFFGRSHDLNL